MDFNIIIIMALIIMASGKPIENRFQSKLPQPQFYSSSPTYLGGLSKLWKSLEPSSSVGVEEQNPEKILQDNPITGEFLNVECNSFSNLTIKQPISDPVQSDFSSSKLTDNSSVSSGLEEDRVDILSTVKAHSSNTSSAQIITGIRLNRETETTSRNPITEEFDEIGASNDFDLLAREETDPVQSDFLANKLSGGQSGGFLGLVTVILNPESTTINDEPTVFSEATTTQKVAIEDSTNDTNGVNNRIDDQISATFANEENTEATTLSSDSIQEQVLETMNNNSNVSAQDCEQSETINCIEISSEDTFVSTTPIATPQETQEPGVENSNEEDFSFINGLVMGDITDSVMGEEFNKTGGQNLTEGQMSSIHDYNASDNSSPGVISGTFNQNINDTNQSKGNQFIAGGNSSFSSQEPIVIVTAITPTIVNEVNSQEPVTIVWASNPTNSTFENQSFGQTSSVNISVSSSSNSRQTLDLQNGHKSSSGSNGQEPITIVTAVSPIQLETEAAGEEMSSIGSSSSSSYVIGPVINGSNPISGIVNEISNQEGNTFTGNQTQVPISGPNTLGQSVVEGQLQNQFINHSSQQMEVANIRGAEGATRFVPEQKPVMTSSGPSQKEFFNRPMEDQLSPSVFGGLANEEKRPTSDFFNHMVHEMGSNMGNRPAAQDTIGSSQINQFSMNMAEQIGSSVSTNEQDPLKSNMMGGQTGDHFGGGEVFSVGMAGSNSRVNSQQAVGTATNHADSPTGHNMYSQFSNMENPQEQKPGGNIPMGFYNQMQNQNFNYHMPSQMFPSMFGGFANQQNRPTPNFFNHMGNRPVEQNTNQHESGFYNQMQNQFFNRPMGSQTFPSFFGGFGNQQQQPTSDFFNPMTHQLGMQMGGRPVVEQAHSHVGTQSSVSSSAIGGQIQNQITNVANRPIIGGDAGIGPVKGASGSSVFEQKPAMISNGVHAPIGELIPIKNQFFPPISNSFDNQQKPMPEIFNHMTDQLSINMANRPLGPQHQTFVGTSVFGQNPVIAATNFHPVTEQFNLHINKPLGSQISTGNFVSTSSVNGQHSQLENGQISVSGVSVSSSVNGEQPVTVGNPIQMNNNQVVFSGISVSSSSANAQKPLSSIFTSNSTVGGQIGNQVINITTSSSSLNGNEPITTITVTNHTTGPIINLFGNVRENSSVVTSMVSPPSMADVNPMQNQFLNRPMGGQTFPFFNGFGNQQQSSSGFFNHMTDQFANNMENRFSEGSSSSSSNTLLQNGQGSFSGVSVSSSSVNGQEPITVVNVVNQTQFQNETKQQEVTSSDSSIKPIGGQILGESSSSDENSAIVNNTTLQDGQNSFSGVSTSGSSSVSDQRLVLFVSAPVPNEQQSSLPTTSDSNHHPLVDSSDKTPEAIIGNLSIQNSQVSVTSNNTNTQESVLTSFNTQQEDNSTGNQLPMENSTPTIDNTDQLTEQPGVKPSTGINISSSSGTTEQITTSTGHGQDLETTPKPIIASPPGNSSMESFTQFFNTPMGGQMFPSIFNGFSNKQQPPVGIFNRIKDQFPVSMANQPVGQVFVSSSIQSSSSSDGQKTQATVTSTDNLTGKVTQTKYESSEGKPIAVFQSISSSSDGNKTETVVTSNNPITGEVSQTKYESSLVKDLPQGSGNSSRRENLEAATSSNFTTDEITQTRFSLSSGGGVNNKEIKGIIIFNQTSERSTSEIEEKNEFKPIQDLSSGNNLSFQTKFAGGNPLKEAVGLSIPHYIGGRDFSARAIVSPDTNRPVTVFSTTNPSIGASTQITYVPYPSYFINNPLDLNSRNENFPFGTTTPAPSNPPLMNELSWRKRKYSIINFNKPFSGGIRPILCKPSKNSTRKVNLAKFKFSGSNKANVPVNTRLSSRYTIYPPAEPVLKRLRIWALQ